MGSDANRERLGLTVRQLRERLEDLELHDDLKDAPVFFADGLAVKALYAELNDDREWFAVVQ